jgi:hypothetical protein
MGLGKKLAIGFGAVVGTPIAAAALYLAFNHSVVYECSTTEPSIQPDVTGAMVVRWNLPALIGERTGRYGVAFLDSDDNVFYSVEGDDRKDLEEKANAFCKTGALPGPAL